MGMKNNYLIILLIGLFLIPTGLFPVNAQTNTVIRTKPIFENFYEITAVTNQTFDISSTVTCFSGPDSAFKVINSSLYNAKTSFYLEVYTLSSEALVNGLIAADARGVDVQVLLSEDRVSSYEDDYTIEAAFRLDQAGIPVSWASSSYAYTHAKFWIVDSKVAYIYSGNWAPSSIPVNPNARENREMGVGIHNVDVANYYEDIFLEDLANGNPYVAGSHIGYLQDEETGTYEHPFTEENVTGTMKVTPFF